MYEVSVSMHWLKHHEGPVMNMTQDLVMEDLILECFLFLGGWKRGEGVSLDLDKYILIARSVFCGGSTSIRVVLHCHAIMIHID